MKSDNNTLEQNNVTKKPFLQKHKITVIILPVFLITVTILILLIYLESIYSYNNDAIILRAAAVTFSGKNPKELKEKDFVNIKKN